MNKSAALQDVGLIAGRRRLLVMLVLFVMVNLLVVWLADASCYQVRGDCALKTDRWGYNVAEALIEHGALVDPADPSQPYIAYTPGYALVMAAWFLIADGPPYTFLTLLQLSALFLAGLMVRRVVESQLAGYGDLAMALLVFNPNVLAQVHFIQPDALEIALITGAFAAAAMFARQPSLRWAMVCGACIGLAMWIYPAAQFLIPALPVTLPLLCLLGGQAEHWRRAFLWGVIGTALAISLISPWMLHKYAAGAGLKITSPGHEHLVLIDSLRFLSAEAPGQSISQIKANFYRSETEALRGRNPDWDKLTKIQQDTLRLDYVLAHYRSFPFEPTVVLKAIAYSWGRFLAAGGEGEIHRLLGLEGNSESHTAAFYGVKGVALGYALLLRLMGLIGMFEMARRGHWGLLLLCVGMVLVFMAGTALVGQPRYRLSVEPQLMVLATFGFAFCVAKTRDWRRSKFSNQESIQS
jgi:hypothetical protein